MDDGKWMTIALARASAAAYVLALLLWKTRGGRLVWTAGVVLYLAHVFCAFAYFYDWSHEIAYRETARQTLQLFGVNWGGGLYLNYAFTVLWTADCVWRWAGLVSYRMRPAAVSSVIHGFLAFMFVNGTVVVWILRAIRD